VLRGNTSTEWDADRSQLITTYTNGDFTRGLMYRLAHVTPAPRFANGEVVCDVALQPGEKWHCCAYYILVEGDRIREPPYDCDRTEETGTELGRLQADWLLRATQLTSSNEDVSRTYERSVKDLGALRLLDQDLADDVWVPAAGVPWYVALFGRDALITSLQAMVVDPGFARGALQKLAQYQATEMDDWRDAEPGKILHELRIGELAHFNKIPHTPYYGAADATPLYLIVLHEAWKWLGDLSLLRSYRDVALGCLSWIDRYGDLDGDGFQEYQSRSVLGYENMGWKDSVEAVVYPDGRPVPRPKALIELQGYVFDAKLRMAEVFDALGEPEHARQLRCQAAELRRRFEDAFWCESLGFYAYGLDPDKQPIESIVSNVGHCLWSGIVRPDRGQRAVRRFFEADLWSGWGIRTLSTRNPAYNPFSYHNGSVWPHDNGLIALGFKRYGFTEETNRVAHDIFEAASFFRRYRLPELYAGLARRDSPFPVQYVGASVPQAWAAGSIFHLLRAILGLRPDAPSRRLYVHPTLPAWLPELLLGGLVIGDTRVTLRFWREDARSRWEVVAQSDGAEISVIEEPWTPWG
jgi:glycogen debranching enzyme